MVHALRLATAALGFLLLIFPEAGGAGPSIVGPKRLGFDPHRAVYEITLDRASPGSGVEDMSGRMVYEMTGSVCEGYAQNMRFVTRMLNQEGISQVNDLRTSSFEDLNKHRLRFSSSQYENQKLSEAAQGSAEPGNGATFTKVELTKPTKKTVKLPSNLYFPVQHSLALLQAAQAGKKIFTANLFDGSEKGEKFYETSAFIGRRSEPGTVPAPEGLDQSNRLDVLASWPISISYFDPGDVRSDATPAYELGFQFYENGVSTKLFIDYGDFAIRGRLVELSYLPKSECPDGKN